MFRKLKGHITSAANNVLGAEDPKVRSLTAMGFSVVQAKNALEATNGDVDRAAELLLAHPEPHPPNPPTPATTDDATMQRVMQESKQLEEERQRQQAAKRTQQNPTRTTAAAQKAGQAAASRANGELTTSIGLASHHPDVKIIPKLQDKSKEEQILRCANRLKHSPAAVDTLCKALTAVQQNPDNDKFRRIDKTTTGYQRSVDGAPGAEDMLRAMSYKAQGPNVLALQRSNVDPALLYLGISALEQTKLSPEYKQGKRTAAFAKTVREIQTQSDASETEAIRRSGFMANCPTEPAEGRGALMQVVMANETVRRRFDSDDQLRDVLHWLGGHASAIYDKILSREWSLVDLNRYPVVPIDCAIEQDHTLQYIGCWPSGRLEIVPSTEEWMQGIAPDVQRGSSRGLGSAPSDAM